MLTYIGYRLLELYVILLPYPIAYIVATGGAMLWFATGQNVYTIKKNISIVLKKDIDDPEVHRLAKKVYINWGKNIVDFLKHKVVSRKKIKQRVSFEGHNNLKKGLAKGKGVVLFSCHIGNFEWGASRIGVEGYKIWGIALFRKSEKTNKFFESNRLRKGFLTVYANKMHHIFRYLKNNELIAIPMDWDSTGQSSKSFDFFGKKAYLPTGALRLAMRSGAALMPVFIWRDGRYTHHLKIMKPINLDLSGGKEESIEKNMKIIIPIMEKHIREHLVEWELFHNIWID